uniref:Uncharacterized protein n=1 Tax=Chenopodium quinoa TaxID=63459 RepID=A0A803ML18_CHEQI
MVNQNEFVALLDEFKKLNAHMDKSEEHLQHQNEKTNTLKAHTKFIQKLQHDMKNRSDGDSLFSSRSIPKKENEIKLHDLLEFDGNLDADVYLDWDCRVDCSFDHKNLDDDKRFSYAILKLTKHASLFFDNMQSRHVKDGKCQINSWTELKHKIHEDEQKMSKSIMGLNPPIANQVELQQYYSFEEVCHLACARKDRSMTEGAAVLRVLLVHEGVREGDAAVT